MRMRDETDKQDTERRKETEREKTEKVISYRAKWMMQKASASREDQMQEQVSAGGRWMAFVQGVKKKKEN